MIKEEEPPKPSTRLSESGEALASISAQRQMEPAKLAKLVRGELDWIVMKSLEKDRNRRYETANGFAADVQRYLNDEPVQACPPSAGYRLRKFARRHKGRPRRGRLLLAAAGAGRGGQHLAGGAPLGRSEMQPRRRKSTGSGRSSSDSGTERWPTKSWPGATSKAKQSASRSPRCCDFRRERPARRGGGRRTRSGGQGIDGRIRAAADAAEPQSPAAFRTSRSSRRRSARTG